MDIPQGVTVLQGPEPDMTRYAASVLYRPGADLDEVLLGQDETPRAAKRACHRCF